MFVIPVGNRVNWNRPPVVTLLLILINCVVFFTFQYGEEDRVSPAAKFYLSSKLPGIEWPRYADYLKQHGQTKKADAFTQASEHGQFGPMALMVMERDKPFMAELRAGRIVPQRDPDYEDWTEARQHYDALWKPSFTERFAFHADEPKPLNAFTSAFLHGGVGHLFGNMLVLFLVGVAVEAVVGMAMYSLAYGASIFASCYAYLLLQAEPGVLSLGASGAIAGVMGLYTVVYGWRKIDFFYSLVFYFDYVRGPAILLLPVWLGNEVFQFYTEPDSNVAFMAHFGGLVCGAAMGGLYRLLRPAQIERGHQQAEQPQLDRQRFEQGLAWLGAMEFKKAVEVFKGLQREHPGDPNLAWQLYRAAKYDPAGEDFHQAAKHLMLLPAAHTTPGQLFDLYREYLTLAKPAPRIGSELSVRLARAFAKDGHCEDAEKLLAHLMKRSPNHGELPELLLALARGYYREGKEEKYRTTLQLLIQKYPAASEVSVAEQLLRVR